MFRLARRGAIDYLEAEELSAPGIAVHAFCARRGGVSEGPYASLNAGFRAGDREADVRRNLSLVGEAFALPQGRIVLVEQVHGDRIHVLDGQEPPPECIPACDGLITDRPGVALGIRSADCVPLLFMDPVRRIVGAAHAGWRGLALGIGGKMVDVFKERFSCRADEMLVAIGPAIGACCYQVDGPVMAAFSGLPGALSCMRPCRERDRWMADLPLAARFQIQAAGVPGERIWTAGYCTACRPDLFFSHRAARGKAAGRQINLIMLRG